MYSQLVVANKHNSARVASCWFIIYTYYSRSIPLLSLRVFVAYERVKPTCKSILFISRFSLHRALGYI